MGRKVGSEEADGVLAEGDAGSGKGTPEMGEIFWGKWPRERGG